MVSSKYVDFRISFLSAHILCQCHTFFLVAQIILPENAVIVSIKENVPVNVTSFIFGHNYFHGNSTSAPKILRMFLEVTSLRVNSVV